MSAPRRPASSIVASRRRRLALLMAAGGLATALPGEPLSKRADVDFFRDVPSRNLHGLATRSDGRLVAGPETQDLAGTIPAELLWSTAPGPAGRWFVGTGPDGRIFDIAVNAGAASFTARELARIDDAHVFALLALPNGELLAGTSPHGSLALLKSGQVTARVLLPADSVFDFLALDAGHVLVATGNPGRIYAVDLAALARAPAATARLTQPADLAAHGISLFGEIRDRNVRRLARLADGGIVAGSAPRGNVYRFPAAGGAPVFLQENRDAEVTDLLPQPNGDLFATLTFSGGNNDSRPILATNPAKDPKENADPIAPVEKFNGRGVLLRFPAQGFPEVLSARSNVAFYSVHRQGDLLVVTGGEQGDVVGYDLVQRVALTFAGSTSAQVNASIPVPGRPGAYFLLRNNSPGLALLDFNPAHPRSTETRRIDLGTNAAIGAVRFERENPLPAADLVLEARTSVGTDEVEGWTAWQPLHFADGGWSAPGLRGRYLKLRAKVSAGAADLELDKAGVFYLPQNRRPVLQDFHILAPNFGLIVPPEPAPPATVSLGALLQPGGRDDDKARRAVLMNSQVVASVGSQVILWNVTDPDGDNLDAALALRRLGDSAWTDVAVANREGYVEFDATHFPDGLYATRLTVRELAPRPAADRLTTVFETDHLTIDHTPPEILAATLVRTGDTWRLEVRGHDALSLLDSIEATFNNGFHQTQDQPVDGIRDSRDETFALEIPAGKLTEATSVEITLYDAAGNGTTRRLPVGAK